jgi:hypothetical protein
MSRIIRAVGLVAAAILAFPFVTVAQGSTSEPCPPGWDPEDPSIVWESSSVRLEADAIEFRRGECVFTGVGPAEVSSDPGGPTYRTLEVTWEEQGAQVGMNIYFAADETDWWITEIRTPTGEFQDLAEMFRTPRGETFTGDVQLRSSSSPEAAQVTFTGLRLTAFAPGTGPGPLVGCIPAIEPFDENAQERSVDPTGDGQPLAGTGILDMTPQDAETLLRGLGYCFTFRYSYPTAEPTDGFGFGYSERWCTAPPSGRITDLLYLPDGELVVFVADDSAIRPERPQPPQGWNCPAQ